MSDHPQRKEVITIVSGLPRSGTSMMMKMLEAGGLPPLVDQARTADEDNPKGYYEFERVKKLKDGDVEWVPKARGKAVKIIAALLQYLPANCTYRVLFMRRAMPEVLASQRQMLIRRGEDPDKFDDEEVAELFEKHLHKIDAWLAQQPHMRRLDVDYNALIENPRPHLERINRFLDEGLDVEKMIGVVDVSLHRQRV
jgi:hypothetical protein